MKQLSKFKSGFFLFLISALIMLLAGCGGGGTSSGGNDTQPTMPPSVTLTVKSGSTTVQAGTSVTLVYTSLYATEVISSNFNALPNVVNGEIQVTPLVTTVYNIIVAGNNRQARAELTITVYKGPTPPPTITLTTDTTTVQQGVSAKLTWHITNATSIDATNIPGGITLFDGEKVVTPSTPTEYYITAKGSGGTTTQRVTVNVIIPNAPFATFTVTPGTGDINTQFNVDASGCTDNVIARSDLQVRWDWTNDGNWEVDWLPTKTNSITFSSPGDYTIAMQVKNSSGIISTTTRSVKVINSPPVANFTISSTSGFITDTFNVDASGSTDKETPTSALLVRWDWTSDGTWDTTTSTTKIETHQYTVPGNYTIKLEVTDGGGLITTTTRIVTINNSLPTANFTISPNTGDLTTTFVVDASTSTDMETPVSNLSVRWDWAGDGNWTTATTTKTASHQYTVPGSYTIKLEVTDRDGGITTKPMTVVVVQSSNGNITIQ